MAQILFSVPEYYQHFWAEIQQECLAGKAIRRSLLIQNAAARLQSSVPLTVFL
ncbi:hypothetical protein NFI96_009686 [Prochilodus magdalenae]|nr:hypothetical protein NFI96_009686 [Prochilodus magdalenae]